MNTTVAEIAEWVGGTVLGDGGVRITGVNGIREAQPGDITFLADSRHAEWLEPSRASAVFVPPDVTSANKPLIQVASPYMAMAHVLAVVEREVRCHPQGIHPTAVVGQNVELGADLGLDAHVRIADNCRIGDRTVLYAGVYIGQGSTVGADTVIYPNVVVREGVQIGARCIIHSGVIIGADGFGFTPGPKGLVKIPQVGGVTIGDDVEIGANSAIDRATFGQTVIGPGTKIDNLVQVGHNVVTGSHCIICGNAGIAGSTVLGNRVTLGAGSGIAGHLEVHDGAVVAGYSGVSRSVKAGETMFGYPAVEYMRAKQMYAALRRLPDALRQVRALERRMAELEGLLNEHAEDDR